MPSFNTILELKGYVYKYCPSSLIKLDESLEELLDSVIFIANCSQERVYSGKLIIDIDGTTIVIEKNEAEKALIEKS